VFIVVVVVVEIIGKEIVAVVDIDVFIVEDDF
jgi:hypothetical protein